jgi:leucyl/phenylalanyl-tRNA--protein transferase
MPVFRLSQEIVFPPPHLAIPEGLLAVGGDLSLPRLTLAYRMGIFPWYAPGDPILWWSPDPRMVIYPDEIHIPRRLARTLRQRRFQVTYDQAFRQVMEACAGHRGGEPPGTWILPEMIAAYSRLHAAGIAHSAEVWLDGKLAGGLYGVSLGGVFFGESMFSHVRDSSKVALLELLGRLQRSGFQLVDCQVTTAHLKRLGAREIPRRRFLRELQRGLERPTLYGPWRVEGDRIGTSGGPSDPPAARGGCGGATPPGF